MHMYSISANYIPLIFFQLSSAIGGKHIADSNYKFAYTLGQFPFVTYTLSFDILFLSPSDKETVSSNKRKHN